MKRDLRYSSWIEKHITEELSKYYSGRTLDVYDIWLIMNILYGGVPWNGMTIEKVNGKVYFTLNVPPISLGIYNPTERTFTTKYEHDPYHRLRLENVRVNIPEEVHEIRTKKRYKWLITKRKIVSWDHAPNFKPTLYIQGRIWSTDGVKGWLERTPNGFAYFAILGTITNTLEERERFFEKEAAIIQGEFHGEEIPLIVNWPHSPKIIPSKVKEALKLREV
uniref:Uncharacterized protein n=1 Tax=Thermococcus sp. IRI48 TaxID=1197734 RepID=L0BAN1_9EURY|nr:hypothetical protein [Thermococcus sp. IRI48]AFZ84234.1 hypothetical protein i48-8 [Thermococcus sp. IRI48]